MNPDQRKRLMDLIRRYGRQPTTWVGIMGMIHAASSHVPEWVPNYLPSILAGMIGAALFVYDEDQL